MTIEEIEKQVIDIIETIGTQKISDPSQLLLNDLSLDSLCMIMLLVMIEDAFDFELEESDMNPFALISVQDVIDLVAKYQIDTLKIGGDQNG